MNKGCWPSDLPGPACGCYPKARQMKSNGPAGLGLRHPLGTAPSELGQHRFHRMDIHAPQCINMDAISSWSNDHEKAQYPWDRRWCRVIGCGALLASVESGLYGAT